MEPPLALVEILIWERPKQKIRFCRPRIGLSYWAESAGPDYIVFDSFAFHKKGPMSGAYLLYLIVAIPDVSTRQLGNHREYVKGL